MSPTSSTPLAAIDAIVLDTETTGLDSRSARILQIGGISIRCGELATTSIIDTLVDPGVPIPAATSAVHGITSDMVLGQPKFPQLVPELDRLLGGALIIGHTITYDLAMLEREYALAGATWRRPRSLDVRLLARVVAPTLADYSLDRLCEWAGIRINHRHSATGDAKATAEVFLALVPGLRRKGVRTLAEAEAHCRRIVEGEANVTGQLPMVEALPSEAVTPLARIDSFPYRHRVRDVMSAPAEFVAPEMSVRAVIATLIDKRISSVLIELPSGDIAIATERDLLRAVHASGANALESAVASFANGPLQTVDEHDHLYRAIGRVGRLGFRHLGVSNGSGDAVGIVTTRNLLKHRSATALMLGDEIEAATAASVLASAWGKLPTLASVLLEDGVPAHTIAGVISAEIQALTRRAAQLAEQQLSSEGAGAPPVPYAVLVLGSAGRGESLLASDQDNAIVYGDGGDTSRAAAYFLALGQKMNDILDTAGLARCMGGVMAGNATWCKSASEWRATIENWISRHSPQDLLNVDIFFDAVWAHGDRQLATDVWNYAYTTAHPAISFQKLLTELARSRSPAFTLLGNFRVDDKGRIDVKKTALMPMFTCARVLSIRHDIRERSTLMRLAPLPQMGIGSSEILATITAAHGTLMSLVLAQQLRDGQAGIPPSAKIVPGQLNKAGRKALKGALSSIDEVVGLVSEGRLN